MKYKYTLTICSLILSASVFSAVYAENSQVSLSDGIDTKINIQADLNHNQDDRATSSDKEVTSTKTQSEFTAKDHRSVVADFVKSLLGVADRNGGIGAQVRIIAREQNDSSTTTIQAMDKVEQRSGFQNLLAGGGLS